MRDQQPRHDPRHPACCLSVQGLSLVLHNASHGIPSGRVSLPCGGVTAYHCVDGLEEHTERGGFKGYEDDGVRAGGLSEGQRPRHEGQ